MDKNKITLRDVPKKDAFNSPKGFFDSFEDELMQTIDEREAFSEPKQIIFNRKRVWGAIAASISLLLMLGTYFWTYQNEEVLAVDELSTVSSEEIAFYLENSALDTETLLEQVDLSLLAMNQSELVELDGISDEEMNLIIEQYEDIF